MTLQVCWRNRTPSPFPEDSEQTGKLKKKTSGSLPAAEPHSSEWKEMDGGRDGKCNQVLFRRVRGGKT